VAGRERKNRAVSSPLRAAGLYARGAGRVLLRGGGSLRERLARPDERLVFVVGSPRSGTTFLGRSLGALPGFVDLGEVPALKALIPALGDTPSPEAAHRIRRTLDTTRRLGLVGGRRAVEQTPESAFVVEALAFAYPSASFVHIVRDGRDVVSSLLERGWLSSGRGGEDDAGHAYGAAPRFWVEAERRAEFESASDAGRAAWAWRRYVGAAQAAPPDRCFDLRYERMVAEPEAVARDLAGFLGAEPDALAVALGAAHRESVGRYRDALSPAQLADVLAEAGGLLEALAYVTADSASALRR